MYLILEGRKGAVPLQMPSGESARHIPDHGGRRFVFAFRHPAAFLAFWNWDTERDSVCQLDSLLSGAGMPVGFSE